MALSLTEEQREALPRGARVVADILAAKDRGDMDEYYRLFSELEVSAETLMAVKRCQGADYIRKRNLRTHLADAKYGPGWLDRED